jgi:hypothetical protein
MDISRYAHEQWARGTRSEEEVAVAWIKLAMASPDPVEMLLRPVKSAISETFRARRLRVEDRAWDNLLPNEDAGTREDTAIPDTETTLDTASGPKGRTGTHTETGRMYLGTPHPASTLDTINELLRTHIWVWRPKPDGSTDGLMIPWAELTVADIEPTIARERDVIAGHERRIARLAKARELMEKHNVTRFGSIPFSTEVRELIYA